ncbi:hypothetical protein BRDID11004_23170 [Bradyrhizobium diazoefficiens]|uniref:Uncharacterized protein n=2 Tax=Bradyrhizobium diazoefficiens TaxID=1355477 RepID=A0A810AUM6_9BRAD|nr:hypothetical protein F07S3_66070 [Bradyrhizobium diazoefficiens]BCA14459.1 hypothetical protein BDHF08_63060 [Bradyrhizobium diazoefficiens]BCE58869.1 hypothetical protein XF5B_63810 [Bradyrhizobium diazoefficiens]BCE67548.1 hypothetical protein XF6B_63470 [Bradyrhizobium diazoefficiens]
MQWGVPARAAGGMARAAALADDERREIARKAVKARWARHLPQATHEGVIRFGDIEIEAAVLNDGQRVITYSGFMMGLGRPSKGRQHHRGGVKLPSLLTLQNLEPFIGEDFAVIAKQIEFRTKQGAKAFGYSANLLPEVCDVFARAQRAGVLNATQRYIADRVRIIAEQPQGSGTIRLIDKAMGYQKVREK